MRGSFSPARSMALRISLRLGVSANFTYTSVPPLKSTPNGMPCQKKIESSPATLKINEKARKYHFLPRKSILVLRNNSTASPLRKTHVLLIAPGSKPSPPRHGGHGVLQNSSYNSSAQGRNVEINQQSNAQPAQPQVRDQLRFLYRLDAFH